MPASRPLTRRARLLLGLLFLALAAGWALIALGGLTRGGEPSVRLFVRVVDEQGRDVPRADLRSRYGGAWLTPAGTGEVDAGLLPLRGTEGALAARLEDALEARAAFHAARAGPTVRVESAPDGALRATLTLQRCGLLRLAVAPSALAQVRAVVDADPGQERWRLLEGREVVRPGEAATWAVFAGAERIGVTLEGDQGVARQRLSLPAPGPGFLAEQTLFPLPATPIAGRIEVVEGLAPPTLAGELRVEETPPDGPPVAHPSVQIGRDGSFSIPYAGPRRYAVRPLLGFAREGPPQAVEGGADGVVVPVVARPWLTLHGVAGAERFTFGLTWAGEGAPEPPPPGWASHLPSGGVAVDGDAVHVAVPWPGPWRVTATCRGSDETPPLAAEAQALAPESGGARAPWSAVPRPHGTVRVSMDRVPRRGGEVLLLPDRRRTWLQGFPGLAELPHVAVGRALLRVRWNDPDLATVLLAGEVEAGATLTLPVTAEPGGHLSLDLGESPAALRALPLGLHVLPGRSPYGEAEGTWDLVRVGAGSEWRALGALRPGSYAAALHPRVPSDLPPVPVTFEIGAGRTTVVRLPNR